MQRRIFIKKEHSRAKATTQTKNLNAYIEKLKIDKYIAVFADESTRTLSLRVDGEKIRDGSKLDKVLLFKIKQLNLILPIIFLHFIYPQLIK